MKLKRQYKGSSIFCKSVGRAVKIEDENIMILHRNGHAHLFEGNSDLKPITKQPQEATESKNKNDHTDLSLMLSKLSKSALNDFKDMTMKEIKKGLHLLEIEYPANASKKMLSELVKKLD